MTHPSKTMRPLRYSNAVVPHIYIQGAAKAVAFYAKAFGAQELLRIATPDGRIVHSELAVCDATIMLGDPDGRLYNEPRLIGACTAGLHLIVDDNAAVLARAVAAGCEQVQPPTDMFYGANSASVRDPFGHVWVLLTGRRIYRRPKWSAAAKRLWAPSEPKRNPFRHGDAVDCASVPMRPAAY